MTGATLLLALPTSAPRAGLDGDGDLDAVFANQSQPNRACLGDGAGGFSSCSNVSADTNTSLGVALGLIDADDNLDAVFANNNQANRVCLGDGAGGFSSCSNVSADTGTSRGVALGLIDADSNLDAVFANASMTNRVCLDDGAGGFSCSDVSADTNRSAGVALAPAAAGLEVAFDVEPRGCRNPLNSRARGVLPAAILGTGDFDVGNIDPDTVRLEGVAPLRFNIEDVATPFEPFVGKEDPFDCTSAGPDSFEDMTLKFDNRAVIDALGQVSRGDVLVLELEGALFDGTEIVGEDVVVVIQ